jgi:putative endonuclease
MKTYCVYILECYDKSYYTGVTNDIDRRIIEHQTGKYPTCYTFNRRPVILKHIETFTDVNQAIAFEKQVKGWSRKKKEALMQNDWDKIVELARKKKE